MIVTFVPGDSAPGNVDGVGELPVTLIVKSAAALVPLSSFTTCLITLRVPGCGGVVVVVVGGQYP
jgi:hypothetical protein